MVSEPAEMRSDDMLAFALRDSNTLDKDSLTFGPSGGSLTNLGSGTPERNKGKDS